MTQITTSEASCLLADLLLSKSGVRKPSRDAKIAGGTHLFPMVQQDGAHNVVRIIYWAFRDSFWPTVLAKGKDPVVVFARNYVEMRGQFLGHAQAALNEARLQNSNYNPDVYNVTTQLGAYAACLDQPKALTLTPATDEEVHAAHVDTSVLHQKPRDRHKLWHEAHTTEHIYRRPTVNTPRIPTLSAKLMSDVKQDNIHPWTDGFAAELATESEFEPIVPRSMTLSPEHTAIIASGKACPRCDGTGMEPVLSGGIITDIVAKYKYACPCDRTTRLYHILNRPDLRQERFHDIRLDETLQPIDGIPISRQDQEFIIAFVKEHQDESFFLYGNAEKGKTHIMTALWRRAIERMIVQQDVLDNKANAVFRANTNDLLAELRAWENQPSEPPEGKGTPVPTVTKEIIAAAAQAGFRVSVFLDEFDKIKNSEFAMNSLGSIIDAVYRHKGQLVATSNRSPSDYLRKWDPLVSGPLIRRFLKGDLAHAVNFDKPRGKARPDMAIIPTANNGDFVPSVDFPAFLPEEQGDVRIYITVQEKQFLCPVPKGAAASLAAANTAHELAHC